MRPTPRVVILLAALLLLPACSLFGQDNEPRWDTDIPESAMFDADGGSWGPQGERIAFQHTLDSANANPGGYDQLWTANLQTGERQMVAPGRVLNPDWSPSGDWFVFHSKTDPEFLYTISADGDSLVRLTGPGSPNPNFEYTTDAKWSPSGDRILFTFLAGNPPTPPGVGVMNANGSDGQYLDDYGYSGGWFPDGERVVFVEIYKLPNGAYEDRLYTVGADGNGERQLSNFTSNILRAPEVSPDGKHIAFSSRGESGQSEIFLTNADGTDIRQVTSMPQCSGVYAPRWRPGDGGKILINCYMHRTVSAYNLLFLLDPETFEVKPVFPKE
jgi:Tol biopolymer transport system component